MVTDGNRQAESSNGLSTQEAAEVLDRKLGQVTEKCREHFIHRSAQRLE
jgi:hypothetical protein